MNLKSNIAPAVFNEVQEHLLKIEKEHNVTVIQAIESGSRAWGFPSPDSDYDVRFVYAHSKDWYLSLFEKRDVIELPINSELDIAGWDLRKALKLANNANTVIQEWMISSIVYKQSAKFEKLQGLVGQAFNPMGSYHHYRSMAKKAYFDIENSKRKKLKRFFYFARATLSASWIFEKQTMPSIVFYDVLEGLIDNREILSSIYELIEQKSHESERSSLKVPSHVYDFFVSMYESLEEQIECSIKPELVTDAAFVDILGN